MTREELGNKAREFCIDICGSDSDYRDIIGMAKEFAISELEKLLEDMKPKAQYRQWVSYDMTDCIKVEKAIATLRGE